MGYEWNYYPPVVKHGVLENGSFISDFPIETPISSEFPIATFDSRRVDIQTMFGKLELSSSKFARDC